MKKFLSLLCAMVIAFCCMSVTVSAEGNDDEYGISPYSLYTMSNTSELSIVAKTAFCKSKVKANDSDATIYITQTFQKKNGSKWENVKKVSKMFYSSSATFSKTYAAIPSGTYRVRTEARVYLGSNSEGTTSYSKTVS